MIRPADSHGCCASEPKRVLEEVETDVNSVGERVIVIHN